MSVELKFNGGRVAVLCAICKCIDMQDLDIFAIQAIEDLPLESIWTCKKCDSQNHRIVAGEFIAAYNKLVIAKTPYKRTFPLFPKV